MTVHRFGFADRFGPGIYQMPDGPYVRSEDYDALAARLAEAERLIDAAHSAVLTLLIYAEDAGDKTQYNGWTKHANNLRQWIIRERASDNGSSAPDAENAAPNLRTADSGIVTCPKCGQPYHESRGAGCPTCTADSADDPYAHNTSDSQG